MYNLARLISMIFRLELIEPSAREVEGLLSSLVPHSSLSTRVQTINTSLLKLKPRCCIITLLCHRKILLPQPVVTTRIRFDRLTGPGRLREIKIELLGLDMRTRNKYNDPFTGRYIKTSKFFNEGFL